MNRRIQLSKSPATDPNTHAGAPTHFQPQPKQKRLPGLRTPLANGADYTNEPENLKKKKQQKTHTHTQHSGFPPCGWRRPELAGGPVTWPPDEWRPPRLRPPFTHSLGKAPPDVGLEPRCEEKISVCMAGFACVGTRGNWHTQRDRRPAARINRVPVNGRLLIGPNRCRFDGVGLVMLGF